jgi:hypothetical protein
MYYSVLSGSCQLCDDEDDDRASNVVCSLVVYYWAMTTSILPDTKPDR